MRRFDSDTRLQFFSGMASRWVAMEQGERNNANHISPHPKLGAYYESEETRQQFVTHLFDQTAPHYEWIIGVMSFGCGGWYRRNALHRAGLKNGGNVLDVAVGTGAVARAARKIVGATGAVTGVDPSRGMLMQARARLDANVVQGVAETLPFGDNAFDFLSMGYALRHVSDLQTTFREYFRVLKPGGTMLILEASRPRSRVGFHAVRIYLDRVMPWIARIGSRNKDAEFLMHYYWSTIEQCVPPETILSAIAARGFQRVKRTRWFGLFDEYKATKPAA
jgi:demethylmenaquinone methyltransferase/2-methoxy-6-polyprenyl-1,4-benzoquinol methylase